MIEVIFDPSGLLDFGQIGLGGGDKGPMFFIFRTIQNPLAQDRHFIVADAFFLGRRWRHSFVGICMQYSAKQQTLIGFARHNAIARHFTVFCQVQTRGLLAVQPKWTRLIVDIWAMAGETAVGEDRADMLIETDCCGGCRKR